MTGREARFKEPFAWTKSRSGWALHRRWGAFHVSVFRLRNGPSLHFQIRGKLDATEVPAAKTALWRILRLLPGDE